MISLYLCFKQLTRVIIKEQPVYLVDIYCNIKESIGQHGNLNNNQTKVNINKRI